MIIPLNAFTLRDEKERVNNSPIVHSLPLPGMLLEGKEKNEKKTKLTLWDPFYKHAKDRLPGELTNDINIVFI